VRPLNQAETLRNRPTASPCDRKLYWLGFTPPMGTRMPRQTVRLTAEKLKQLARAGAEATLKQLRAEIIAIKRTFPELRLSQGRRTVRRSLESATTRTWQMSAAARKAVSQRMKRYWAERRKAKAKVK
jgi:hypothetical protein